MKNVLIIKNSTLENAAYFEKILTYKNISCVIVDREKNTKIPDLERFSHVLVLGGPKSAYDDDPQIHEMISFIQEVIKADKPYLGVCLGMQLLAVAVGGEVKRCDKGEIGFGDYTNTILLQDKIFNGLHRSTFKVFQLHNDCVMPSPHYDILCKGNGYAVQMIRHKEKFYGIQAHIEIEEDKLKEWLERESSLAHLDKHDTINHYKRIRDELHRSSEVILGNFLELE